MIKEFNFKTHQQQCWVNLLEDIKAFVAESGVQEGL